LLPVLLPSAEPSETSVFTASIPSFLPYGGSGSPGRVTRRESSGRLNH
jgi:hypothetical protein